MMQWCVGERQWLELPNQRLEARCWGPAPCEAPTLVLLHEGLGSIAQWKHFPEALSDGGRYGVFAYSRAGYGASSPTDLPRPLDYLQREAIDVLPQVLDAIGLVQGYTVGHSDGASIAAVHAGEVKDPRIHGTCLMAPHFFTEDIALTAIAETAVVYEQHGLRERLARYHQHVDNAFYGWKDAWLNPKFKRWNIEGSIRGLALPALGIQGREDQYGTLAQLDALATAGVEPLTLKVIDDCKHIPHLEAAEQTVLAIHQHIVAHRLFGAP